MLALLFGGLFLDHGKFVHMDAVTVHMSADFYVVAFMTFNRILIIDCQDLFVLVSYEHGLLAAFNAFLGAGRVVSLRSFGAAHFASEIQPLIFSLFALGALSLFAIPMEARNATASRVNAIFFIKIFSYVLFPPAPQ